MQMMINNTDPGKGHFYVSIVKSVIRIAAGVLICLFSMGDDIVNYYDGNVVSEFLLYAGLLIIGAEVLGIVEEIV